MTYSKEELVKAVRIVSTLSSMYHALKVVTALDDHPEAWPPGYMVRLDPKAREQLDAAIAKHDALRAEYSDEELEVDDE